MSSRFCLYGYSVENNIFVVNETEAKIITEVFEKYLSGLTLKAIADNLTERQVNYYKEKNTWNKNMVSRIIGNAHYIGDEKHPKIVDEDVYIRASSKKQVKVEREKKIPKK